VRLVLDTNAAVSGLLWHGNPGKLIDAAQAGSLTLYTSAPLLAELHGVLGREKFTKHLQDRELTATEIVEGYAAMDHRCCASDHSASNHRGPRRRRGAGVRRCGPGRSCGFGDPHLVKLGQYEGIPIVTPAEAVERVHL
jgi:putative PIN family toxin of toxin-antitoxin system